MTEPKTPEARLELARDLFELPMAVLGLVVLEVAQWVIWGALTLEYFTLRPKPGPSARSNRRPRSGGGRGPLLAQERPLVVLEAGEGGGHLESSPLHLQQPDPDDRRGRIALQDGRAERARAAPHV